MADPARKRLSADDRRDRLLEVGAALFETRQFAQVSVDDIARAAGVSKGLLYHYFSSKEEFFLEGYRAGAARLLEACAPDPSLGLLGQIEAGVKGYLDYAENTKFGYLNLFRDETMAVPGLVQATAQTRRALVEYFVTGLPLPDMPIPVTRVALYGFLGFAEASAMDWLANETIDRATVERLCFASLHAALRTGLRIDFADQPDAMTLIGQFLDQARDHFGIEL